MKTSFVSLWVACALVSGGAFAAKKSNVPSEPGLVIEEVTVGKGKAAAKAGSEVAVHYTGVLENGTKFDSSLDRGEPIVFVLGQGRVIPGWDKGLVGMKVGGKRKLKIAPELAYGDRGAGDKIPPGSTLLFDVELVKLDGKEAKTAKKK